MCSYPSQIDNIKERMAPNKTDQGKCLLWGIFGAGIVFIVIFYRIFIWNWEGTVNLPSVMVVEINHPDSKYFKPFATDKQIIVYQKLLKGFIKLLPNVTYLMMYGTLLGSYRHHGMIPWDADIDLVIRDEDKNISYEIFKSLKTESEYKFEPHSKFIWRFFHNESEDTGDIWKWPYIDIYFYAENKTHIWNTDVPKLKFEKSLIFPLKKRPFMGVLLPSPRHPKAVLEKSYSLNTCVWTFYAVLKSHPRSPRGPRRKKLSCHFLYDKFPFVKRRVNGSGIIETLERGNVRVPGSDAFFVET